MVTKEVHAQKAWFPIIHTLSGIVTLVSLEQALKALSPIIQTDFGIFKDDKEHPKKAYSPIPVRPFCMETFVKVLQPRKVHDPMACTVFGIDTLFNDVHIAKAWLSMVVIVSGIDKCANEVYMKAWLPMVVKEVGNPTVFTAALSMPHAASQSMRVVPSGM